MSDQATTPPLRPHRRQFMVGPSAVRVYDDWCCRQLGEKTWISHCPSLRADWVHDADRTTWGLLGIAVETLLERAEPAAQIARTPSADVADLYMSWAGRWVLIGRREVHMDAAGLLGCFYGRTSGGETWVSSSPALLARVLSPDRPLDVDHRALTYEAGISWFTPPRSRFTVIRRLLPSQIIDLGSGCVRPRPLMPEINPARSYAETLELFQQSLVTTMRRLPTAGKRPWLGLTAGFDSRLMLTMARAADVNVMPFTRITSRMSLADRLLPPKIARDLGYEHVFLRGHTRHAERKPIVIEHSAGHVSDGDAEPLLDGVRDSLDGISFGGHGFAIASGFARLRQLPHPVTDPGTTAQRIAAMFKEPAISTATIGIREWLEWVLQTPQEHLDWRDRFFLEQRQAGWLSSKEQVYDLTTLERFPLLNAGRNYALLLGLREDQRLGSLVQADLIGRLAPQLSKYPFNPRDNYFSLLRKILTRSTDDPSYVPRVVKRYAYSTIARKRHRT